MRRTLARVARTLLLLGIGLELAWLVGVNAVLALHVVPHRVASKTRTVALDYRRAWSLYPGDLHLRGFWARGTDSSGFEWMSLGERADATFSLPALLHHTFKATHVVASDVSIRFRRQLHGDEQPRGLRYWPPIPGFAVRAAAKQPSKSGSGGGGEEKHHTYWNVDLEHATLHHVREVWAFEQRLQGDGEGTGRLLVRPHTRVELGPFTLAMPHARLLFDDQVLAPEVALRTGLSFRPYDPHLTHGRKLLGVLTTSLDLEARLGNLAPLRLPLDAPAGTLAFHGSVIDGTPQPGTRFSLVLPDARAKLGPAKLRGELSVQGELQSDALALEAKLRLLAHGGALALSARVPQVNLERGFGRPSATLRAHQLRVPDLRALNGALPEGLTVRSGSATLNGVVRLGRHGGGRLRVATGPVELALAGQGLRARLDAHLRLRALRTAPLSADLAGTHLALTEVVGPGVKEKPWTFDVNVGRGKLALEPRLHGSGELDAQAPDAKPVLQFLNRAGKLPGLVAGLFDLPHLRVHAQGRYAGRVLTVAPLRVAGGHTALEAGAQLGQHLDGAMLARLGPANVALQLDDGKVSVVSLSGQDWFNQRLKALEPAAAPPKRAARSPAARRARR